MSIFQSECRYFCNQKLYFLSWSLSHSLQRSLSSAGSVMFSEANTIAFKRIKPNTVKRIGQSASVQKVYINAHKLALSKHDVWRSMCVCVCVCCERFHVPIERIGRLRGRGGSGMRLCQYEWVWQATHLCRRHATDATRDDGQTSWLWICECNRRAAAPANWFHMLRRHIRAHIFARNLCVCAWNRTRSIF